MEAPASPREASPAIALLAVPTNANGTTSATTTVPVNRKRKHAAVASVAASSPAPSDRASTPADKDNLVLPARNLDLSTRPRLSISRHPNFVPIAPGSPYCSTEPLCINRLKFRYTPAGLSHPGSLLPFRTIESAPAAFRVSWEDRSPFVKVTHDGLGLRGDKGFRSARCNAPVREGKWYMEVRVDLGGGDKPPDSPRREGAHVRLGWARREAPLNGPAGLDGYSYAVRDKSGDKVHLSRPRPYGTPFKSGDVVGMYISLPSPRRPPNRRDPHDPAHVRRERIAIEFKGQEYFESFEYSPSKEMLALMEPKDRRGKGGANTSAPAPPSAKKSATVKNIPSTSRGGAKTKASEPAPLRPLPTLGPSSFIAFFVNGECQGIAFQDLYDYLPLRVAPDKPLERGKRGNKDNGLREHKENPFDDGSLGYYPVVSLFNEARVRLNPGPDFEFPPPPDIDGVLLGGDAKPAQKADEALQHGEEEAQQQQQRTWRPMCERYPEYMAEQFALDELEEAEAKKRHEGTEGKAKTDAERIEAHRAKRRAQAAARKEKKRKERELEDAEADARGEKRRKIEDGGPGPSVLLLRPDGDADADVKMDLGSRVLELKAEGVDSPAPTVASSVDAFYVNGGAGGVDTSEYNTENEEVEVEMNGEVEAEEEGDTEREKEKEKRDEEADAKDEEAFFDDAVGAYSINVEHAP